MEQLVARWAHNPKVTGSSPVPATKKASRAIWRPFLFNRGLNRGRIPKITYIPSAKVISYHSK
jgi:hypothetical protein